VSAWLQRSYGSLREDNKTSIMLQVEDGPGALQETLKFFWKHDVNMTRIESRPAKGHNMNYSFYIDFEGKRGQPEVDELMDDLKKNCLDVMVLHDKKGELPLAVKRCSLPN
jgi:prephenate dehydratase